MVQALVGSFVASVIALGVSTMMVNSKIQTRKIQLLNTLSEQKMRLEFLMRDQNAFSQSVNLNTNAIFTALKAGSAVTETDPATGAQKMVLYDSAGNALFNTLGPSGSGLTGNGITEKGGPCTNFDGTAGNGNDNCPISYRILVGADCPGAATTCTDPQLKIVARMMYNPSISGSSQLNKFRTLLPQRVWNATSSDSIADSVEDLKYDAVVKRTASSIARGFKLYVNNLNAQYPGTSPGGCPDNVSGFLKHPRVASAGWTVDYDPHSLVSVNTPALGDISFNETGYYQCSITAPAFAVGGFAIKFRNTSAGTDHGMGSSVAPQWSEATARLETSFNILNPAQVYTVQIKCDSRGTTTAGADDAYQYALGVTRATYGTPFRMVEVTCSKMDDSF
jgi:hypothetical protein